MYISEECTYEENYLPQAPRMYDELMCDWTNEKSADDFDWHIDQGSETGGPDADHTLQTDQGTVFLITENKN